MNSFQLKILMGLSCVPSSLNAEPITPKDELDIEEINVVAGRVKSNDDETFNRLGIDLKTSIIATRLDDIIGAVPGVHLFRRANSLTAHPTTQGLGMRAIGANAAGRALVTLDGVPLNDPFGGWIYWSALDVQTLDRVMVKTGRVGGAFSHYALSGKVALHSKGENNYTNSSASMGSQGTYEAKMSVARIYNDTSISGNAGYFETDGQYLLGADQRGAIDVPAASNVEYFNLSIAQKFNDKTDAYIGVKLFKEDRINGLNAAPNSTKATDWTFRLAHNMGDWGAELISWYKNRDMQNTFASARDDRTTERPVLDQFDVPAWGTGGALRVISTKGLEAGVDWNRMSGEVNERYRNLGDGFTRVRQAGGDQQILGAFIQSNWGINNLRLNGSLRLDTYDVYNGIRQENDIATDALLREEDYEDINGTIPTGGIGFEYDLGDSLTFTGGVSKTWRLPTLNEYYRPFRVVNDITEANAALTPEKLVTLEAGLKGTIGQLEFSGNIYHAQLKDGVGNVTIGFGPGFFPLGGFVPGGGVLRQRTNIAESITDGVELDLKYKAEKWDISFAYLYADARVTDSEVNIDIIGNRPVQTPKHSVVMGVTRSIMKGWWTTEMRFSSNQFDDDLNERALGNMFLINTGVKYEFINNMTLNFDVLNVFNNKVVSGLSSTGLETLALRRTWRIGVSFNF